MINSIRCKPWLQNSPPKKILAIRLQALGDTLITLPYLFDLKQKFPNAQLHLLTREEVSGIPGSVTFIDSVITIGGGRSPGIQFASALLKVPLLLKERYSMVIDLQNNWISRFLRKCLRAKAWSEFDRYSLTSAGERTRLTIEAAGVNPIFLNVEFQLKRDQQAWVAEKFKLPSERKLVVLNPAGFCPSRNWPVENYISFARMWLNEIDPETLFILLLLPGLGIKAEKIRSGIGASCLNLTGHANQVEAFHIIRQCTFVLTEDSGLMHMAWIQKVPTLALFSSSRKEWSQPGGAWSSTLDSSDLECGPCMKEICIFGDNRCLTRYTPELIISKTKAMLKLEADHV